MKDCREEGMEGLMLAVGMDFKVQTMRDDMVLVT